jgi:chaperonin GroES
LKKTLTQLNFLDFYGLSRKFSFLYITRFFLHKNQQQQPTMVSRITHLFYAALDQMLIECHFQSALKSVKNIVPLLDRVLVQRAKAQAQTASGIYIPEKNVEKLNEAHVLAVGPGSLDKNGNRLAPSVQAGDRVLIPPFGGSSIKVGDEVSTTNLYTRFIYLREEKGLG